jgi:hypothetical protein
MQPRSIGTADSKVTCFELSDIDVSMRVSSDVESTDTPQLRGEADMDAVATVWLSTWLRASAHRPYGQTFFLGSTLAEMTEESGQGQCPTAFRGQQ